MKERVKINGLTQTVGLLKGYRNKKQEHFGIICVDSGMNLISKKVLFKGGASNTTLYLNIIFWEMCKKEAVGVILFHNHPSGNVLPSKEDIETTVKVKKWCDLLGIQLLDHVIISSYRHYSFKEHDLIDFEKETEEKIAEKEVAK